MDLNHISLYGEEEVPANEFNDSDCQDELPMAIEEPDYLRPSTSTEIHSENTEQNKGREKRLREEEAEEDETEWTLVKNKEKRQKPQNKKVEMYVSCPEKLPKQFSLARLLKNNDIGEIERIKYVNPYKIRLEMNDEMSAEKLEKCKEFTDRGWHVQRPFENNLSYGVIRNVDLDISDEEIVKSISCPSPAVLVSIHRLKRRNHSNDENNAWSSSECVRLCFKGAYLPAYVAVDGLKIRVEPYVFPVSQCSRCWKLGHAIKKCPATKVVCPKCGGNHANCETTNYKCVNCKGNHMSLVKTCPAFRKEKRLRDIMAEFNCTYRKALTIYVPPKEDKKKDDHNKMNVAEFFSANDNLFPKLPTPRAMPVFSQMTVETEADIHQEEGSSRPKTPLRPKRIRSHKEGVFDFGFQFTEDEPKENVERENKEDRHRGKFNCLHLQLYRDPKDRYKKGQTKASLSLQQFLGFESGFTLDKESNTIAIVCQDVTVVLAFETRERLISWQVKVGTQLGSSKEFLVMIGGSNKKLPPGPARLHLQGRRFALTSGVPPRLLGLWELAHLRRYGVVEGRFCFEGGSHCGKGEGLHLLITDQAQEITDAFDSAARGDSLQRTPRKSTDKGTKSRPSTRLSDFNVVDASMPDTASALYEQNFFGEECGETSPYWPSDERRYDEHEHRPSDIEIGAKPPWSGADHVTLERCTNCLTKLGTMSQPSTVPLDSGPQFNPAWTMDPVPESSSDNSSNSTEYLTPRAIRKALKACQCKDKPPDRPPKPAHLDQKKPPASLPVQGCTCGNDNYPINNPKVGPYENYDVPKTTHAEMDNEYYDTPKRLKQALADDLFQVTKPSTPGSLVLKKNCGCILKFASKKKPVIVECKESIQSIECPCQKVTNWANNLISLPYCKRNNENVNTEIFTGQKQDDTAIYATVDISRKTNRQSAATDKENTPEDETQFMNYQNIEPKNKDFEGPYANYENLEFALSLEYYENAKDLLKKAGVTQTELDALSANVEFAATTLPKKTKHCPKCIHAEPQTCRKNKQDEYLLMEPAKQAKQDTGQVLGTSTGYTPMSPNPNWSQSLRHPLNKVHRAEIEKSHSIPALIGSNFPSYMAGNNNREAMQKRSSSVDSARLLEDLKEFDSSIGSHATSSSLETLRNMTLETRRSSSPCDNDRECYDCCKSSGSENKTSESFSKDAPALRNKHMDNAQIKRSSSVPCKSAGNRDSSSSNDSGVSSCSLKHGGAEFNEFEMPLTSGHSKYQYMVHRKMRGSLAGCTHASLPRKSKSSDPLRDMSMQIHKAHVHAKSSSAEAEVPVLPPKQFKGVMDTHSTSSGTSDMSDYIETLSLTSSHSSSDAQSGIRLSRQPTNTLRPRSGKEYHNIDPIITSMYKNGKEISNYTNIP